MLTLVGGRPRLKKIFEITQKNTPSFCSCSLEITTSQTRTKEQELLSVGFSNDTLRNMENSLMASI